MPNNEKSLLYYLTQYLNAISMNLKLPKKPIKFLELQEMLEDLDEMFSEFYKEDPQKCSELAKTNYLGIIKKMFELDRTTKFKANYQKYMRNAYRMASYSSLHHYMLYREWDEYDKFYLPRLSILQGYIHYLQELVAPESKVRLLI